MYKIVYNSDVIIEEQDTLSSLCVFYDQVILPHITSKNYVSLRPDPENPTSLSVFASSVFFKSIKYPRWGTLSSGEDIEMWELQNKALIENGVLQRLHPPKGENSTLYFVGFRSPELFQLLLKSSHVFKGGIGTYFIREATLTHLLRDDIQFPSVFLTKNRTDTTKIYTTLEAQSVFRYVIPMLSDLHPDQILEVREKVSDNREGFLMHLQKLSKEVELRIEQGAPVSEISSVAQDIVATDLIPDYTEFRRQLEAEKAGFWAKVLDRSSKILEIDAAPWTPKFWADLI